MIVDIMKLSMRRNLLNYGRWFHGQHFQSVTFLPQESSAQIFFLLISKKEKRAEGTTVHVF